MKDIILCVKRNLPKETILSLARSGADKILIYDETAVREDVEEYANEIKEIVDLIDTPIIAGGGVGRFEDVKKLLYAGAQVAIVDDTGAASYLTDSSDKILEESEKRFGKSALLRRSEIKTVNASTTDELYMVLLEKLSTDPVAYLRYEELLEAGFGEDAFDHIIFDLKMRLSEDGIPVKLLRSSVKFSEFKTDSAGLVPCIVQDYKTGQVLMMAYMNEESYEKTLETGLMTYWSRSREKLWTKGEESGHFSYVRSLDIDCDKDTILAKVHQVGPACHTGNQSCFYTRLTEKDIKAEPNPENVLTDVYKTVMDRKENPREGSYTNYLFEKGIDKILKKVGEEATEIVIAAKNPDPEEIKYEMADFLYHAMVLMAEKGVTWEDIADELARRE